MCSEFANSLLVGNALGMAVVHISIGFKFKAIGVKEKVWNYIYL
jgi:hypothetical protein